ncbi:protealysin inhibitor emfourin [Microbacterium oleivorans]|uniref:protealysin inhibitor emfourin n=1 Tax=Microbacterium oleivorans TaxID=273677 RepID=UPI00203E9C92|nr:protealysin inhibitor emfourin [Microbacterium oleivorans]MCM3695796.1 hypothetical protein [Microbacterium oleivorans]
MSQPAEPLTIVVVRSGGFAGLRRAWRVEIANQDAGDWMPLIEACPWEQPAASAPGADRFSWEVAVAGSSCDRRASLGESDAAGPWRELIERVRTDGESVPAT